MNMIQTAYVRDEVSLADPQSGPIQAEATDSHKIKKHVILQLNYIYSVLQPVTGETLSRFSQELQHIQVHADLCLESNTQNAHSFA